MKMMPRVSIIILNWNGLKDTVECLASLKKIAYPNYEVIVVDNGSKGNDAQVLEEEFGDYIKLVRNDKNYGYTGGNNIGIRCVLKNSSPDYFLILNNDTVVAPDFLGQMIKVAESDASVGIVGPQVYYYDFPNRIQSAGASINIRTSQPFSAGTKQELNWLSGCCLLIKKELIQKVGLFDESYFCYWDENDYCFRAKESGYKVVCIPEAKMWHKAPMHLKVPGKTSTSGTAGGLPYYYMARNRFRFMRKHATKGQYRNFLLYFFGYYFWFVTAAYLLYYRDIRRVVGFCRGVRDGMFNSDSSARHYRKD
jgi:GT2 family glycosyltransferase